MKKNKQRAIVSTVLLICFILVAATSAILYFNKSGIWMGIMRFTINEVHTWSGIVMMAAIIYHFILNWTMYKTELKALKKNEESKK